MRERKGKGLAWRSIAGEIAIIVLGVLIALGAQEVVKDIEDRRNMAKMGDFYREMGGWIGSGQVKSRDTVVEGIDNTLDAFLGLFSGANTGKMLVKL